MVAPKRPTLIPSNYGKKKFGARERKHSRRKAPLSSYKKSSNPAEQPRKLRKRSSKAKESAARLGNKRLSPHSTSSLVYKNS